MDVPQVIANRFRVECEIGRGGMGTVYRATHLGLDRPVAVKVLKKEIAADPEVAERFMREARTMAKLRHPRAAMIFDAGKLPDGRPFIVMEHVEGSTLADVLARDGRFAPERAVRVAAEICDVLTEAHRLGIVHRDLKPSNIMLNERGVSVLDFGIAKVLANSADATKTHATTESGLIIGTPRYMSPEQCTGQSVGPASDLYSVGVLVYEMLAGQPPFTDNLQSAVLVKQATTPPPPLVARRADVPRRLALVVHALLAKSPSDRPKSARDARLSLERAITIPDSVEEAADGVNTHAPFASTLATMNARASRAARGVTALAVVAVMGGAMFFWSQSSASWRANASTVAREAATATTARSLDGAATPSVAREASRTTLTNLSSSAARQIAASLVARGIVSEAQALRTQQGTVIAAVQEDRREGATQLLLFEPRGALGGFRAAGRVTLDKADFSGAKWTTEAVDSDGDGYDEIVCTGFDAANDSFSRRLVLYSPRARESFSMRVGADNRESKALRVKWSSNAGGERARLFRKTLRERALADLPSVKS
ncbi:MAG: serine/threonine protein kinase [Acidobacteria bacterium]|nr:serine/threonine protein kinase [Acidobacteriota bacterium]MCA1642960.1 serine/threonine protein kinase [Acidobacteriota bacterium]